MPSISLAQQEVKGRGSWTILPYRHSKAGEWIWELNRLNLTYLCFVDRVFLEVSKTSAYTEINFSLSGIPFHLLEKLCYLLWILVGERSDLLIPEQLLCMLLKNIYCKDILCIFFHHHLNYKAWSHMSTVIL